MLATKTLEFGKKCRSRRADLAQALTEPIEL